MEGDFQVRGHGEQVDRMRCKERCYIGWHPNGPRRLAYRSGYEGGELGLGDADSRGQILRHGVEESADQPGFAAVQVLQAVKPHICSPKFGVFHSVTYLL